MFAISITVYFGILCFSLRDFNRNIVFTSFLLTLFAFLYASPVATILLGSTYDVNFSDEAKNHLYFSLLIGTVFLAIGYYLPTELKKRVAGEGINEQLRMSLQRTSKTTFYFVYLLKIIQYIEIAYYVVRYGYMFYYTDYHSSIPLIIEKISDLYIVALSIFFATSPTKEDAQPVVTFFLFGGLLSILTGKRYEFVYVILLYIIYSNVAGAGNLGYESNREQTHKGKSFLIVLVLPILIVFLLYIGAVRSKNTFEFKSITDSILEFMVDIGNSGKVIMRGYQFRDELPKGKLYSFGSLIEYVKYNYFSRTILGVRQPNPRTLEYVQNGHIFAYAITYFFSAESFFSGHGQGSSYIAELFADFGYSGIVIGSLFLGAFIRKFFVFSEQSIMHNALAFFMVRPLLFMPRDTYCLQLTYLLNVKYLTAFLLIYYISVHYSRTRPITRKSS